MSHQVSPLKILAIGSPLSALANAVAKITAINAKHGPFDAVFLVGEVFSKGSDGSELDNVKFPVPTYFTLGKIPLPDSVKEKILQTGGEVADNLVFLGTSAILTTAQGLKVACIGGGYDEATYNSAEPVDPLSPVMTNAGISSLLAYPLLTPSDPSSSLTSARNLADPLPSAFSGIDILLLSSPPPNLASLSPGFASAGVTLADPAPPLAEAVKRSRPRYMFWGRGEGFWEREPMAWTGPDGREERWTRAVKLGALGGEVDGKKARWFYAFTLPPQTPTTPLPARPANATANPFVAAPAQSGISKKRAALEDQESAFAAPGKKGRTGASLFRPTSTGSEQQYRQKTDPSGHAGPPPEGYICKVCGTPGHWIQDCPQKQAESQRPPPGYTCNVCQSPDHFIRECPNREAADAARRNGARPPPPGYVCRACGMRDAHLIRECPIVMEREGERTRKKELGPGECWFCLSNPKVTKHLIVAIGAETYVTLPKGQLIPTLPRHIAQGGSKPLIPGGGHVLIIPLAHHPTLLSIPPDEAMTIISELESYKSSLRGCYESYGAVPVTFEVGRLSGRGGHAHVQVVPVPKELTDKVAIAFRLAGEKQGLVWEEEPEKALIKAGSGGNYFKVECPDGTKLVHLLRGNFDLQFGRMVLAGILGLHHRIDWKECAQSEEEEKEDALRFKKAFAPFHP